MRINFIVTLYPEKIIFVVKGEPTQLFPLQNLRKRVLKRD